MLSGRGFDNIEVANQGIEIPVEETLGRVLELRMLWSGLEKMGADTRRIQVDNAFVL